MNANVTVWVVWQAGFALVMIVSIVVTLRIQQKEAERRMTRLDQTLDALGQAMGKMAVDIALLKQKVGI